jgi:Ftsk gamma domain/LAGLIDADG-like domain
MAERRRRSLPLPAPPVTLRDRHSQSPGRATGPAVTQREEVPPVTWVLTGLGVAVIIGIIAVIILVYRAARHALGKHPLPKLAWRWFTGLPWDGRDHVPDATWLHRGSEEANVNGKRVRAFYYRCRLARTVIRLSETAGSWLCAALLVLWGLASPVSLGLTAAGVLLITGSLAAWTAHRWLRTRLAGVQPRAQVALYRDRAVAALPSPARWEANRELYRPLHNRAHHHAGIPPSYPPRRWIQIAPDRQMVTVTVPDGVDTASKAIASLHQVVTATVFCDNKPDVTPITTGRRRKLVYTAARKGPPELVLLDPDPSRNALGIRHLIKDAKWHELVLGYGVGDEPVVRSLGKAVPHWGLSMPSGDGKALDLATPVPTPSGWTTMGEIKAGDVVFDETGAPCTVTHAWAVRYDRPCYEVVFSDGSVIVADGEHQWLAETFKCRSNDRRDRPARVNPRTIPKVVTTATMAANLYDGKHVNYSVRTAGPLQCPDAELPVSPYALGCWLGDGTTRTGAITSADPEIISEIEAEGYAAWIVPGEDRTQRALMYRIEGLTTQLRAAGVLNDKHIPDVYLRASEDQRRALLAGLLDTDGYCNQRGGIWFYSTKECLAQDVFHLAATLGYKPQLRPFRARFNGQDAGPAWSVYFITPDKVFRLPRKATRQRAETRRTAAHRYVTDVRPVPSRPVRCIAVDSPSHLYLAGAACIPTHNSVCAELLAAQMLFHGAVCIILDYKVFSHPWALFKMPNVSYAGTTEQIHLTLEWLMGEAARRKQRGLDLIQMDGTFAGIIGFPIFVVAEELNATIIQLKAYWTAIGGTGESPAVTALREMLFTGRQLGIHFLLIAQKLTVAALGGKDSAARENCAGILMGGSASASSWKMLADDVERPAKQSVQGRHFVVDHGNVTLCQVAYLNPAGEAGPEARQLALSGTVTRLPEGIPEGIAKPVTEAVGTAGTSHVTVTNPRLELETGHPAPVMDVPVTEPAVEILMGIAEACKKGILPCSVGTARARRAHDPRWPKHVEGVKGPRDELLYVAGELHQYARIAWGEPDETGKRRPVRRRPRKHDPEETPAPASEQAPAAPGYQISKYGPPEPPIGSIPADEVLFGPAPVMPGGIPVGYVPEGDLIPSPRPQPAPAPGDDPGLLAEAAEMVISTQFGSVKMLHRKLRVPFTQAEGLMGELEALMIVGPEPKDPTEARTVLVPADDLDEVLKPLRAERPEPRAKAS